MLSPASVVEFDSRYDSSYVDLRIPRSESQIIRLLKYFRAVSKSAFWPAIVRGVMPAVEHIAPLRLIRPALIIDVGANKGQFSLIARYLWPKATIYAFEPLDHERSVYDSLVTAPACSRPEALGNASRDATFYVASRADSSSLLAPGENQELAYGVVLSSTVSVRVERLQDVIDHRALVPPVLLKIDVQGGELDVLKGAENILHLIDAIYCEVSFVQLYEKQSMAGAIVAYLERHSFSLRGVFNLSNTKKLGPTQADFLFCRER